MKPIYTLLSIFLFSFLVALPTAKAQLVVDFSANTTFGCDFEQVNFTNLTTDGGVPITTLGCDGGDYSFEWNFNPGFSDQCEPGNIFSTPGLYEVCLTVTNNVTGASSTECKPDYILIFELPVSQFSASPNAGCEPLTVTFTNESSVNSGNIVNCIWDFGDGVVVNDCSPTVVHEFTTSGDFNVSLTVLDDNGCPPVTSTNVVAVTGAPEIVVESSATFGCELPFVVDFDNESPETANITFEWTFENGTPATFTGVNPPPVTWNDEGSHSVSVVATNDISGCTGTLDLPDYIGVGSALTFDVSSYSVCLGDTVYFDLNAGDDLVSVDWDFGDGGFSSLEDPFYVFNTPGCFSVSVDANLGVCSVSSTDPICIDVQEDPVISFSSDNDLGCEIPHVVNFTANTPANVTQWSWEFGAGGAFGASTEQNPTVTITEFGTHPVTLTATTSGGCSSTFTSDIVIEEINVNIGGAALGCVPVNVSLEDNSSSPGTITDWLWEVEGFGTFTTPNPQFVVTDTGVYDVTLTITNSLGCEVTEFFPDFVQGGEEVVVDFAVADDVNCIDTAMIFSNLSTPPGDAWFWDFGDGGTSFEENAVHEYNDTGFFQVCLTTFDNGCPATLCKPNFVYLLPPKARFNFIRNCDNQLLVEFDENSLGADSLIWDFGVDGIDTDTSSLSNPSYEYPEAGDYFVTLTVFNFETGCSNDVTRRVRIRIPEAEFSLPDSIGCARLDLQVSNSSEWAGSYEWIVPPGVTVSDPTIAEPEIRFTAAGDYSPITLIVANNFGCLDTFVLTDTVRVGRLELDFSINPSVGCIPLEVDFTDLSIAENDEIVSWEWEFGDGNTSTDQNPTNLYTYSDTFNVKFKITSEKGCIKQRNIQQAVIVTQPIAEWDSDTVACTDQDIQFLNTSRGESITYFWDFGDGTNSIDAEPLHSYNAEGVYDVCLTVTDINGCDSTLCKLQHIEVANPISDFTADTTFTFCPPLIVTFENLSTNGVSGEFLWDFGDGTGISNADSPAHVYTEPGVYDVTMITTAPGGCTDTLIFEEYIVLEGPEGDFRFEPDTGCAPHEVTFYTNSENSVLHIMDFGEGSIDSSDMELLQDTFTFTYVNPGEYVPALILVDENGCSRVFDSDSSIIVETLDVNFFATDTVLCDGGTIDLNSFINTSDPITSLEWTFEGISPSTSTDPNPTGLVFDTFGEYGITLTVSNGICDVTVVKDDYIKVDPVPVADFTWNPTSGCIPADIQFTDQSTVASGSIGSWDWDLGNGQTSSITNPSTIYNDLGTYDVTLEVSSEFGCTHDTTKTLEVFDLPDIAVNDVDPICVGATVELEAVILSDPTGTAVSWTPDIGSLTCTDCLNPMATPGATTTYTAVLTNMAGCTASASVTVEVLPFPQPNINLTEDTIICLGTTIQLFANGGVIPGGYEWDTSRPGLSCYDCPNPFAEPETTQTYVVTVTGEGGCSAIDSVEVEVFPFSLEFAGSDRTVCLGDTVRLSHGSGSNPTWAPSTGLNCVFCENPVASPLDTTVYTVTVIDDLYGCPVTDTVVVNVIPLDAVDAGVGGVVCSGDTISLGASAPPGSTIFWSPPGPLDNPNSYTPIATVADSTEFVFTAVNDACILSDTILVEALDSAMIMVDDTELCVGDTSQLFATGVADSYTWSPALGLSDPNIPDPFVSVNETTTFTVTGTLGNCPTDTKEVTVTVNGIPEADILPVHSFFEGQEVQLNVNYPSSADYAFQWDPVVGLNCEDCPNPIALVDTSTVYNILVTDKATGCTLPLVTELRERFGCDETLVMVPNAFSPNGDGQNDILYVRSTAISQIAIFRVYNRWGEMVFQGESLDDGWDGTYNGKPVNPGVYVYYVEAPCPFDGNPLVTKGNVTVIR